MNIIKKLILLFLCWLYKKFCMKQLRRSKTNKPFDNNKYNEL